eukprot:scaffold183198_cov43-Prasinocladus_malaysianus.AAC.1
MKDRGSAQRFETADSYIASFLLPAYGTVDRNSRASARRCRKRKREAHRRPYSYCCKNKLLACIGAKIRLRTQYPGDNSVTVKI